jgi:septal ring factor EnvC (AmiA/AmiB activator)
MRTKGYVRTQVTHASREGNASASVRPGAIPMAGWACSAVIPDRPRDYVAAFKAVPTHFGARYRKGAPLGVNLQLNVSPDWIREAGDLHDERNERNQRLYQAALEFVRNIRGVVAARMDLDEEGGGVVDIYVAPVFPRTSRLRKDGSRGSEILEISVSKLNAFWREQSLWAAYCAKNLDPRIQRGDRKSETGREHLTVPEFKAASAYAKALVAEAEAIMEHARREKAEVEKERWRLADEAEAIKARAQELEREQNLLRAEIQMSEDAYEVAKAGLEKADTNLADRRRQLDEEAEHLTTAQHEFARTEARLRRDQDELAEKKQKLKAQEERLARERAEHAIKVHGENQLIENLRAALDEERTNLKKLRSELQGAIDATTHAQREMETRKAEVARDHDILIAEKKTITQERETLGRQSNAQATWAGALEKGVDRIFRGWIPSRDVLKEQVDLQPAMDPLLTVFDRFLEIHQIAEQTLREQSAAKRKRKEAQQLFADLAAHKVRVEQQMGILSNALDRIGQIQQQLSRESQEKFTEARIGFEQVNVIRRRPDTKPSQGLEI